MTAKNVEGLEKKDLVITVVWVVDAMQIILEGTDEYMNKLNEIGSAVIISLELRDKE